MPTEKGSETVMDRPELLPPKAIFDALQDFFVDQVSRADIINAWKVSHTHALRNGNPAPADAAIIQQSINYLLDTAGTTNPPLQNNSEKTLMKNTEIQKEQAIRFDELPFHHAETPTKVDNQPQPVRTNFFKEPIAGPVDRKGKKRVLHIDCSDDEDDDDDEVPYMPPVPSTSQLKKPRGSLVKDNRVQDSGNVPLASTSTSTTPLKPKVLTEPEIISKIHEILPDVERNFAIQLYHRLPQSVETTEQRILHVVNHILEQPSYPKNTPETPNQSQSSSDATEAEEEEEKTQDEMTKVYKSGLEKWTRSARENPTYISQSVSMKILAQYFPLIPVSFLKQTLAQKSHLAPTWIHLETELCKPEAERTIPLNKSRRNLPRHDVWRDPAQAGAELQAEFDWLMARSAYLSQTKAAEDQEKALETLEELNGLLLECQCCYDSFRFVRMIQCPEGHLFCSDCVKRNADVQIGSNKADIKCMDTSDCQSVFSKSELSKVLNLQMMKRLEQIELEASIDQANIEGLEKCPFCVWAVIIENPEERVFRCGNQKCLKETCRQCKKATHIPKTCEEARIEDAKINSIHVLAEAMTDALIRKCPKCRQSFVKESGCNKMRCMHCQTLSCYVCQQIVTGYDHFMNAGPNLKGMAPDPRAKCPLWDDTQVRHDKEIEDALRVANEKLNQSTSRNPEGVLSQAELEALRRDPVPRAAAAHRARLNPQAAFPPWAGVGVGVGPIGVHQRLMDANLVPREIRNHEEVLRQQQLMMERQAHYQRERERARVQVEEMHRRLIARRRNRGGGRK